MTRTIRIILLIVGGGLALVSLALELIGQGGIGPYQIVLIALGALLALLGITAENSILSKITLGLLATLFSLAMLEGGLRLMGRFAPPTIEYNQFLIADPALIHRMPANAQDHDANGWRNPQALTQADVVVLGDSQTWGVNATLEQTWPYLLNQQLAQSVYSLALGGYGPLDYHALTDEALALAPQQIIVALYFGNDLFDSLLRVYTREPYASWRATDPTTQQLHRDYINTILNPPPPPQVVLPTPEPQSPLTTASQIFLDGTNIGRYLQNALPKNNMDTLFTVTSRLNALKTDEPAIDAGLNFTLRALGDIHQAALENDAVLSLVLIPTKELAYRDLLTGERPFNYDALIDAETQRRNTIIEWARMQDIAIADTLPDLQTALAIGRVLYPADTDGHPLPEGYRVIAESVRNTLLESHSSD